MKTQTKLDLQNHINNLYAPNHNFNIDTLEGLNDESRYRIKFYGSIIKGLVKDKVVLDIGANKGVFSLLSYRYGARKVIAQDIDPVYTELIKDLFEYKGLGSEIGSDIGSDIGSEIGSKIEISGEPVLSFWEEGKYGDIALVLGVAHYLTYEHGFSWIYRLFAMGYDLLVELPIYGVDPVVQIHSEYKKVDKERLNIVGQNFKLLSKELFLDKCKGLYNVTEMGLAPGLGRSLFYCKRVPVATMVFEDINFENCEKYFRVGGVDGGNGYQKIYETVWTKVFRNFYTGGNAVFKITRKWENYEDRWIRAHTVLKKEFPYNIPGLFYLVKDGIGNTKGIAEEYIYITKNNVGMIFKIQNFLSSINLLMKDIHPNHIYGQCVIDLEFIEDFDEKNCKYLRNRILNDTWIEWNLADKSINRVTVNKFLDRIRNGSGIENMKEIFRDAEKYSW